jgi:cell division protein FtsB
MRRSTRTWLGRGIAAVLVAGALGYVPYHVYARSGLARTLQLRQELATLRAHNAALAAENQRLEREAEALRDDPEAIERVARTELGWVRPGEIIVDLSSPSPGGASARLGAPAPGRRFPEPGRGGRAGGPAGRPLPSRSR